MNQEQCEAMAERATWAIQYGSHATDVCEANEEAEQFGRDVLALLAEMRRLEDVIGAWQPPLVAAAAGAGATGKQR